jgi:hypothetical protein
MNIEQTEAARRLWKTGNAFHWADVEGDPANLDGVMPYTTPSKAKSACFPPRPHTGIFFRAGSAKSVFERRSAKFLDDYIKEKYAGFCIERVGCFAPAEGFNLPVFTVAECGDRALIYRGFGTMEFTAAADIEAGLKADPRCLFLVSKRAGMLRHHIFAVVKLEND